MSTLMKLIALMLFMNLFLYVGFNFVRSSDGYYMNDELKFHWKGDLIDTLMNDQINMQQVAHDTRNNLTNYNLEFTNSTVVIPSQYGGEDSGSGGISFLDALKIVWSIIPTLFNIAISPLTLLFNFRMPVLIGIMVGIPYFVLIMFSIFMMIRGVSD